jgi:hypothetical protein
MNKIIDPWANPGKLLDALVEGWVVAEISHVTLPPGPPEPPIESRRERGIQRVRASRISVSDRFRAAR